MYRDIVTCAHKLRDEKLQDTLELFDTHSKEIQLLYQVGNNILVKGQVLFFWEKHLVDYLEYDVLHRGEVESLHCKFCTILDVYAQMYIIFVIVLDSEHQTEISSLLLAIIPHHMNQIV